MKLRAVKKIPISYTPPAQKRPFSWGKFAYLSILLLIALAGIDKAYQAYSQVEAVGILEGEEVSIESPFSARILRIELEVGQQVTKETGYVFFDQTGLEREIMEKEGERRRWKAEFAREKKRIVSLIDKEKARLELEEKKLQGAKKALLTHIKRLSAEVDIEETRCKNFEMIKEQREKLVKEGALTQNEVLAVKFQLEPAQRRLTGYKAEIAGLRYEISGQEETINFLVKRHADVENEIQKQSRGPVLKEKIRQAEIETETLRGRLRYYVLSSPIDGIVTEILKKPGEMAGSQEIIARVVNPSTLQMKGYIQPEYKNDFPPNASVDIQFDNGISATGIIENYDPVAIPLPSEFCAKFKAVPRVLVAHILPKAIAWPAVFGMTATISRPRPFFTRGNKP